MDGERFDAMTRALGAGASRRRVLAGLLAGTVGLLGLVGPEDAAAHNARRRCQKIEDRKRRRDCLRDARRHNRQHADQCGDCAAPEGCLEGQCTDSCASVLTAAGCTVDAGQVSCPGWTFLYRASLAGCNLDGAGLGAVNLLEANLSHANLGDANLLGTNLSKTNLTGADLSNANATAAALGQSNLTDADLTDADLTNAGVGQIHWDNTTCPDGTNSDANGGTCCGHFGVQVSGC